MSGKNKPERDTKPQPKQPFKGSEEIIRNLSTLPEGQGQREDLLSEVATPEDTPQQEQSVPNTGRDNNESE